jgi:hypothetical protein
MIIRPDIEAFFGLKSSGNGATMRWLAKAADWPCGKN